MEIRTENTEEANVTEAGEPKTSRIRFLKQLGMTLAVGVGAAAAFARPAFAAGNCCRDCSCGSCGGGNCYCFCDCSAVQTQSYCYTQPAGCLSTGCVQCPC